MSSFYVSATAANGIAAGNDQTGNGSRERPWATIGRARMAAANGDTVYLNDGIYSPSDGVYAPAKTLEISNSVSWMGVRDYGATIRGVAGQSRVVGISEDQAGTVTFGKINIDGANGTTSLITLNSQASTYGIRLDGTRLLNPTSYGIQGTSSGTRARISLNNVQFSASSALSMLNVSSMLAGGVTIQGGSVNIASAWRSGFGGIATVNANAAGVSASISGVVANLTATGTSATGNGAGLYYGIRLTDVAAPLIENNNITQNGTSVDQIGSTVLVTYDRLNPFNVSGGIIRYNTLRNYIDGGAGKIILVGADSDPGDSVRNYANNFQIYGNSGFGDQGAESAKLHGILVGWQTGAKVYDNSMDYTSLAYVMKGMSGQTLVFDNTDTHTSSKSLYQKGGTGVQFLYNTSYQTGDLSPDIINIGDASSAIYNANNATVIGNSLVYTGTPDSFLTVSPGSSIATISGNNYYSATGNVSSAWSYKGTNYKTIEAWRAAVEGSATANRNVTLGQGAILDAVGVSGQPLKLAGMVNGVQTYRVTFTTGVAGTTTFAIGNFGASGAAAISGTVDANTTGTGNSSLSGSGLQDGRYGPLGSGGRKSYSVSYDGLAAVGGQVLRVYGNYTNTRPIEIQFSSNTSGAAPSATHTAPVSSDVAANKTRSEQMVTMPFASTSLVSPEAGQIGTDGFAVSSRVQGVSLADAGFPGVENGTYSFTGGAASALYPSLDPTVAPHLRGGTSAAAAAPSTKAGNTAPLLTADAVRAVADDRTVKPFAGATVNDPDRGAKTSVTVQLDDPAKGSFASLGGFTDNGNGLYAFSGSPDEAQKALRAMVFDPADGRVPAGKSELAQFTVTASDGMVASFDERITVIVSGTMERRQSLLTASPAA
ncbi:beta strand repeat-containing protein [Roseomonas harenae]|uniref:beta strand repeat-containing protein n=1 Tax=Muricoccus harenae TaxID=2692566 RepID=UPI0013318AA5|nr:hypothetical protein [Roseomonas harenae]